ncbi:SGNH/GDSL hydrolase family protein [Adhaeribacter aquaticus]|uniref:SGNH/GDSL hydrolase family protein n=1 Tax=Adhaeribacter aquaticus TaxID=299567 RepID=UPI0004043224|nr:SGNH/GDSL hydrolase family protein [Adhaeribacter aquaticus]
MSANLNNRRKFLKCATLASLTAVVAPTVAFKPTTFLPAFSNKQDHLTILFQGDSITDGNRGRNTDPNHIMGHGYAFSIASRAGAMFPDKALAFYNRGISGNTISDLEARWQQDTLALKPDVLSLLVGVNDTERAIKLKDDEATKRYEAGYRNLLDQVKSQNADCVLVLCEPFISPVGRVKANWQAWQNEMQQKQAVVRSLAKEYQTIFVPLQKVFDVAAPRASADYWVWDGIHPTVAGHELIVQEWLKQVSKKLPLFKKVV